MEDVMAEFLIGKAADGKFVCESRQIREYKDEDKYELQVLNSYPLFSITKLQFPFQRLNA